MHQRTVLKSRVEILSHDPSTGLTLFKGEPAEVAYNKQMKDQFMKLMADLEKQKKKKERTLEEGLEKAKKEKAWKKSKVYIKKKRPGRKSVKMIRRMVRSMKDPYPRINMTYRQRSCLKKIWVEPLWKTYTNRTLLLPAERDALLKKDAESSQTPPSDKQIQAMRCMSESMVRITVRRAKCKGVFSKEVKAVLDISDFHCISLCRRQQDTRDLSFLRHCRRCSGYEGKGYGARGCSWSGSRAV